MSWLALVRLVMYCGRIACCALAPGERVRGASVIMDSGSSRQRDSRRIARLIVSLVMSVSACGLLAVSAQAAAPTIEGVSAKSRTSKEATLEATINPGGFETSYEFWVENAVCQNPPLGAGICEAISIESRGEGRIAAGSSGQTVSTTLTHLSPGYEYTYWVVASNSAGKAQSTNQKFTALPVPAIDSESVSDITATDATLEAQIDTEGLETNYQFKMWASPCAPDCELIEDVPLPSGKLLGSFVGQSVSLDLNSAGVTLTPGGEYGYSVSVTSAAGSVEGKWQKFTAPKDVAVPSATAPPVGALEPDSGSGSQVSASPVSQSKIFYALPQNPGPSEKLTAKHHFEVRRPAGHKKPKHHRSKAAAHKRHKARKHR